MELLNARPCPPMPLDDAPSPPCCDPSIALAQTLGGVHRCPDCGSLYEGALPSRVDLATAPRQPPLAAAPRLPPLAAAPRLPPLAEVIADVQLALRWRREHQAIALTPARSPLARLQGEAAVSSSSSSSSSSDLWRLIASPESRVGRRARAGFVEALVDYCDATSRDDEEPDWSRARALAARLDRLARPHAAALTTLAHRCRPDVAWSAASLVVADALAPNELRAQWTAPPSTGRAGRPRVDPLAPPPALAAEAWGDQELRAALAAWGA